MLVSKAVDGIPKRAPKGFTLVELIVAMAVFMLLLVILASINSQSLGLLQRSRSMEESLKSGRLALELIARRLSQATVSPYWALDDVNEPTRYLRQSRLRFLTAPADDLVGPGAGPGSAIFFQAPLGRSDDPANRRMVQALNTCGFYVERGTDPNHPDVDGLPDPPVRYRLMAVQSTAEEMTAFVVAAPGDRAWFTDLIDTGVARPIAENVVLLVVRPMRGSGSTVGEDLTTNYVYDSVRNALDNPQPATANQLPPFVDLTLVAVDDASYAKAGEPILNFAGLFQNVANYDEDIRSAEEVLRTEKLDYRVFQTRVALVNSKWSE